MKRGLYVMKVPGGTVACRNKGGDAKLFFLLGGSAPVGAQKPMETM